MIFAFQEILTLAELKESLNLSSEEIAYLVDSGLPFYDCKGKKLFLTGSVRIFLGRNEKTTKP